MLFVDGRSEEAHCEGARAVKIGQDICSALIAVDLKVGVEKRRSRSRDQKASDTVGLLGCRKKR